jgi:hypothetical protein
MEMSTADPSFDRRARGYDCPQCPATTDEPCRTPRGAKAQHSHHQRVRRAKAAHATAANDPSYDLRARKYACPFCGAGTNEPCRKPFGGDAAHSHLQRVAIAKDQAVHALVEEQNRTRPWHTKPVDGPQVRMAGTTAHVYVPAGTDHIIIGYLES